jgi:hypothetical protein
MGARQVRSLGHHTAAANQARVLLRQIQPYSHLHPDRPVKIDLGAVKALTGDGGSALRLKTWLTF